ncbi:MAG: P-II family nitrogen regulator [Clostridiaceae bacterium]|nr:P-II family nitrogen regulator [Clostridiaceae bacterium]
MGNKITKIEIIMNSSKFEELKEEMNKIGVTGMTVSNVMGCGLQKGHKEYYRGVAVEINLLPKLKVEIVVCEVPVEAVIESATKILRTGNIGDGKIFIYEVTDALRIRTGERGEAAIIDPKPVKK